MFGKQSWKHKQTGSKWWVLLFVCGAGLLLLFGQGFYPAPATKTETPTSPSPQIQEPSLEDTTEDTSFLAEYDPDANSFFASEADHESSLWPEGGALALKLIVVLGLVYAAMSGLRWLQKGRHSANRGVTIQVLETATLASGQMLHLVVVGEKTLLVGATNHQLSLLTELAEITAPLPTEKLNDNQASVFEEELQLQQQHQHVPTGPPSPVPAIEWQTAMDSLRAGIQRLQESVGGVK